MAAENTTVRVEFMVSRIKGVVTRKVNEVLKGLCCDGNTALRHGPALFGYDNEVFFRLGHVGCCHEQQVVGLVSFIGDPNNHHRQNVDEIWVRKQIADGNFTVLKEADIRKTVQSCFSTEGHNFMHYGIPLTATRFNARDYGFGAETSHVASVPGVIKVSQTGRKAWEKAQDKAIKAADKRIRAIVAAGRELVEECILSGDKDEFKTMLSEFAKMDF